MAKPIQWIRNHLPTQRRLIQLYAALLYNAHLKGFLTGSIYTGSTKALCVPGFNCYSCPGAVGACPLGALQNAVAASGNRAPFYVVGILMLYGITLGRSICGFLCPLGLLQELLHKIPTCKVHKSPITRVFTYLKYVILFIFVLLIPLRYALQHLPVPAFCKFICPAGTFEGALGLLSNPANSEKFSMLGILFTRKFVILLAIILACVFLYRAFCRFLCPLGAIYGLFSKVAVTGIRVEAPKCTGCRRCIVQCPMDILHVGDHECIHCGQCIDICPTQAITLKAGKATVIGPKAKGATNPSRRIRPTVWILALTVLIGALIFFNRPQPGISEVTDPVVSTTEAIEEEQVPVGNEVGMLAPDFTVPLYSKDGGEFTLSQHRGKPVVVNFWATWCTPCCEELPYFDQLFIEYSEEVSVIAIHTNLVTDDVEAYLEDFSYRLPFALDATGEVLQAFGGSTMLPQTVVIDPDGIIVYNAVGSVTYPFLKNLLAAAPPDNDEILG